MIKSYIAGFKNKGYASKTIIHHLSVLKMILTYAVIDGLITSNPAEYITVPKGLKKTKRVPLSREDVEKVKMSIDKPFGLYAFFILYTGIRKSEALALQFKDIDFDKREINISKAWYAKNNRPHIKTTKTNAGERIIHLLKPLADVLPTGEPDDYIFGFPDENLYSDCGKNIKKMQMLTFQLTSSDTSSLPCSLTQKSMSSMQCMIRL